MKLWILRRRRAWKLILEEQEKIDKLGWKLIFSRDLTGDPLKKLLTEINRLTKNTIRLRKYYDGKKPFYTPYRSPEWYRPQTHVI